MIMLNMTSIMSILIAGIVMGIMYFIIDFDWKYWAYVGVYTAIYTIGLFISIALEVSLMSETYIDIFFKELLVSYEIYILLSIVCYVLIGMVVVYILRTMKNSDKKIFMAVGIITQLGMTIFIQQILGNIIS